MLQPLSCASHYQFETEIWWRISCLTTNPFSTNHSVTSSKQLLALRCTRPLTRFYKSIWTTLCWVRESAPCFSYHWKYNSVWSVSEEFFWEISETTCETWWFLWKRFRSNYDPLVIFHPELVRVEVRTHYNWQSNSSALPSTTTILSVMPCSFFAFCDPCMETDWTKLLRL